MTSNFWHLLLNWLQDFLMGWLLVLRLKECLLECATVCIKSEVILSLGWVSSRAKWQSLATLFAAISLFFSLFFFTLSVEASNGLVAAALLSIFRESFFQTYDLTRILQHLHCKMSIVLKRQRRKVYCSTLPFNTCFRFLGRVWIFGCDTYGPRTFGSPQLVPN